MSEGGVGGCRDRAAKGELEEGKRKQKGSHGGRMGGGRVNRLVGN